MTEIEKLQAIPQSNNIVSDIRTILSEARGATARAVNQMMVVAYWLIGKRNILHTVYKIELESQSPHYESARPCGTRMETTQQLVYCFVPNAMKR